jgi:hypothetical protein
MCGCFLYWLCVCMCVGGGRGCVWMCHWQKKTEAWGKNPVLRHTLPITRSTTTVLGTKSRPPRSEARRPAARSLVLSCQSLEITATADGVKRHINPTSERARHKGRAQARAHQPRLIKTVIQGKDYNDLKLVTQWSWPNCTHNKINSWSIGSIIYVWVYCLFRHW